VHKIKLPGRLISKTLSADLKVRVYAVDWEGKESNMIIVAGGRGVYSDSCTSTGEFVGV